MLVDDVDALMAWMEDVLKPMWVFFVGTNGMVLTWEDAMHVSTTVDSPAAGSVICGISRLPYV